MQLFIKCQKNKFKEYKLNTSSELYIDEDGHYISKNEYPFGDTLLDIILKKNIYTNLFGCDIQVFAEYDTSNLKPLNKLFEGEVLSPVLLEELLEGQDPYFNDKNISSNVRLLLEQDANYNINGYIDLVSRYFYGSPLPDKLRANIIANSDNTAMYDEKGKPIIKNIASNFMDYHKIVRVKDTYYSFMGSHYKALVTYEDFATLLLSYEDLEGEGVIKSVINRVKRMCPVNDDLLRDEYIIAFKNCLVDLRTKQTMPFSSRYFVTNKINAEYIGKVTPVKEIDDLIFNWANKREDIVEVIKEIIGFIISPNSSFASCVLIKGGGANGKSTFFNMIKAFVGNQNLSYIDFKNLSGQFSTISLKGKLLNIGDDIDNDNVRDMSIFKKLVTGEDMMVEAKGIQQESMQNYAKLMFSCNSYPTFKEDSEALYRRIFFLPFYNKFCKENGNIQYGIEPLFATDRVKSYLASIAVEYAMRIIENNGFTSIPENDTMKKEHEILSDSVCAFIDDLGYYSYFDNKFVQTIYKCYCDFCSDNGYKAYSKNKFTNSLEFRLKGKFEKRRKINPSSNRNEFYFKVLEVPKYNMQNQGVWEVETNPFI